MFIQNGICYAGEKQKPIKVSGIRPLKDYRLWIRFNNGEARVFDFKPLLSAPAFQALRDEDVFRGVYIDYGVAVWQDGDIDIAPEYLYENSLLQDSCSA